MNAQLLDLGSEFPIFQVSMSGHLNKLGSAVCLEGGRWYARDPIIGTERLFECVPYFLSDSQPQGFIGRDFSKQHPELKLPERIVDWNDDDIMVAITNNGNDTIGNLIVGDSPMRAYLTTVAHPVVAIKESECSTILRAVQK